MSKVEINMLYEPTLELVEEGKVLASCSCGAFLDLDELRKLKCRACQRKLDFVDDVLLQATEFLPKC
jgi:hypothetical protein